MKILTTYEYSEISYEAIVGSNRDSEAFYGIKGLETLFSEKYSETVEFKLHGVAFKNFVGVIKVGDTYIEVLPKIYNSLIDENPSLNKNEIYKNLNYMINKSSRLSIKNIDLTNYGGNEEGQFLDFFINMFLQELYTTLFKGIYKTYVTQQENLRYIKGRLLVAENIKRNFLHNRVYCEFDEFTEDNLVNQILKYTTRLMSKLTNWRQNQLLADNIIQSLNDVSDIHVSVDTFAIVREDRLLGIYSKLLGIAKMFLEGQTIDINSENLVSNFIFNIDMNLVYQEYIFEILNEYRADIFNENITIRPQYSKEHLIFDSNNKGVFLLKPDIALLEGDSVLLLIDTKYKKLNVGKHRYGVSDKDLYQMFGYFHKYNRPLVFLLYPRYESDVSDYYRFEKFKNPSLFVSTVSLSNRLYTIEGELAIVESLKNIFKNQSPSEQAL
jgi:5-methylcytosine-specific restriction enzyme subunit McrC